MFSRALIVCAVLALPLPVSAQAPSGTAAGGEARGSALLYEVLEWVETQPNSGAAGQCRLMSAEWPLGAFVDDTITSLPVKLLADGNGYRRPRNANPRPFDIPWTPDPMPSDPAAFPPLLKTVVCYAQYAAAMEIAMQSLPGVVKAWKPGPAYRFSVAPIDGHSAAVTDKDAATVVSAVALLGAFRSPGLPKRVMTILENVENRCSVPDYTLAFTDKTVVMRCGALAIQPWQREASWDGKPIVGPHSTEFGEFVFKFTSPGPVR